MTTDKITVTPAEFFAHVELRNGMDEQAMRVWAHSHAVEDMAIRNEANEQDATGLRRIAVNLGEVALDMEREDGK